MSFRQWFSPQLPISNTAGLRDMAVLGVGPTATSIDLRTLFGGLSYSGQKLWLRAEAPPSPSAAVPFRAYFSMSPNPVTVDETQINSPTGLCWPIENGETFVGRLMGGESRATGYATMTDNYVLNFKSGAGQGSGFLRIFRSTDDLSETKAFRIPMPSGYGSPSYAPSGAWFPNT